MGPQTQHSMRPTMFCYRMFMALLPVYCLAFYALVIMLVKSSSWQQWSVADCERKYCLPMTRASVLFAIKSATENQKRRALIRKTFVRQIREFAPQAAYTFYISNDTAVEEDVTCLALLPETKEVAISIKTHAFFQTLTRRWDWVCHVDDDSYVQVYRLMDQYLTNVGYYPFRTVIARKRHEPDYMGKSFDYPGGQMYCLSSDLVAAFASWPLNKTALGILAWPADDLLLGYFLSTLHGPFRFVELSNVLAYDIGDSTDVTAYAHRANPEHGINAHRLKTDAQYAAVAAVHELTYAF